MSSPDISSEDVVGAVTFEDLVPPVFLLCPPKAEDRTFTTAAGRTWAEVTLPEMAVFDAVDRAPVVEYPFTTRNFTAIGAFSLRLLFACVLLHARACVLVFALCFIAAPVDPHVLCARVFCSFLCLSTLLPLPKILHTPSP